MKKEYYKLKDIKADILTYKKSLRWYPKGSDEYMQVEKELNRLIGVKEKLKRENAGNIRLFSTMVFHLIRRTHEMLESSVKSMNFIKKKIFF